MCEKCVVHECIGLEIFDWKMQKKNYIFKMFQMQQAFYSSFNAMNDKMKRRYIFVCVKLNFIIKACFSCPYVMCIVYCTCIFDIICFSNTILRAVLNRNLV